MKFNATRKINILTSLVLKKELNLETLKTSTLIISCISIVLMILGIFSLRTVLYVSIISVIYNYTIYCMYDNLEKFKLYSLYQYLNNVFGIEIEGKEIIDEEEEETSIQESKRDTLTPKKFIIEDEEELEEIEETDTEVEEETETANNSENTEGEENLGSKILADLLEEIKESNAIEINNDIDEEDLEDYEEGDDYEDTTRPSANKYSDKLKELGQTNPMNKYR